MNIINGINDFEKMIKCNNISAMIEFWDTVYYPRYKDVLGHQLTYLYHADKNIFYQFIKNIDVEKTKKAIRHYDDYDIEADIMHIAKSVADDLKFNDEFDIYIMVGFGHVAGTSGIGERPFVYYGVESILWSGLNCDYIVPHEMNHMVRLSALGSYSVENMRFCDGMILEGLGCSIPCSVLKW